MATREEIAALIHRIANQSDRCTMTDDGKSSLLTEDALCNILIALGLIKIEG